MVGNKCPPHCLSPRDLSVGKLVFIQARTHPGINKLGGQGTISKIHFGSNGEANEVDVKYVLGGCEKNIQFKYVSLPVELDKTSRRGRRSKANECPPDNNPQKSKTKQRPKLSGKENKKATDVVKLSPMKSSTSPGSSKRKRPALTEIDSNHGEKKKQKSHGEGEKAIISHCDHLDSREKETWLLVKEGKRAIYDKYLQKGRTVSYWWDKKIGWVNGVIEKEITKRMTSTLVKWEVTVKFDDGEKRSLCFDPNEKRWKIRFGLPQRDELHDSPEPVPKSGKKFSTSSAVPPKPKSINKKVAKSFSSCEKIKPVAAQTRKNNPASSKCPIKIFSSSQYEARSKSSTNSTPPSKKKIFFDLTPNGQLAKAEATKAQPEKLPTNTQASAILAKESETLPTEGQEADLSEKHTKAPEKVSSTPKHEIYEHSNGLSKHPITKFPRDDTEPTLPLPNATMCPPSKHCGVSSSTSKRDTNNSSTETLNKKLNAVLAIDNEKPLMTKPTNGLASSTFLEKVFKEERQKAASFVQDLLKDEHSDNEDMLELTVDTDRKHHFNTLLHEVMMKKGIDTIEVKYLMDKLNSCHEGKLSTEGILSSQRRDFTLLEAKTYLTQLDKDGLIFMAWDEGSMGSIYRL